MRFTQQCTARIVALLLAFPFILLQGSSQRPAQQEDPQFRIRSRAELVVVPVTVKDAAGALVADILADEFRVLEDGIEQAISVYSQDAFPISAVVLLDNALPLKAAQQLGSGAPAIAAGFAQADEVSVVLFDEFPHTAVDFTNDNDKLYDNLKRMQVNSTFPGQGSGPMTAGPKVNQTSPEARVPVKPEISGAARGTKNLDDAIYAAGVMLKDRGRERRKIIFVVSDGANSRNNRVSFDETLKLLLTADVSVYAVGVGQANLSLGMTPLSRYARMTGGDVFYANSRGELESLFSRVTEQARNQYTLAYAPKGTDRSREFHSIEVKVRRGALTILARDGYYTTPTP
jgi:VWFA-related protein